MGKYFLNCATLSKLLFPAPTNKKGVMRFLELAGYDRKFVAHFSDIVASLTNLLQMDVKFIWDHGCQEAFESVKTILTCYLVLKAPSIEVPIRLAVDAREVGLGLYCCRRMKVELNIL